MTEPGDASRRATVDMGSTPITSTTRNTGAPCPGSKTRCEQQRVFLRPAVSSPVRTALVPADGLGQYEYREATWASGGSA